VREIARRQTEGKEAMKKKEAKAICKRVGQLTREASRETRKSAAKELRVTAGALRKRVTNAGFTCDGLGQAPARKPTKRRRGPRAIAGCGCGK